MDLELLQDAHAEWLRHNFPQQEPHHGLLGVVEEVGELSHAHLKAEQGIRAPEGGTRAALVDAVGDIVIYLASYCTTVGLDLNACVAKAWDEVSKRDWVEFPKDGVSA